MQVSVESTGNIERKIMIEVPSERVDQEVNKRLKDMRGRVKIDGFRPGKVPPSVIKERYGQAVFQEVAGEVIQQTLYEAANQEEIRIAGGPTNIEPDAMGLGKPLKYTATVEVYPEFEIGAIDSLSITRQSADIEDADIDKMIEVLRKQQQEWVVVEAAAEDGNQVVVDFEGKVDGEVFDGGVSEDYSVELGAGRMLPDFEKALVGMSAGEEKEADVAFPEDYQADDLKGKTAQFTLKVREVKQAVLPEINEEFIKKFGVEDGTDESFRVDVRGNMERELDQRIKASVKQSVMDGLFDLHEIDAPSALVKDEIGHMKNEMAQNNQFDPSSLPDDLFKDQAERRVKLGLIVGEIIKQAKLEKDDAKIDAMLNDLAASYEDKGAVIEYYKSNPQAMQTVEAAVMEEMIVDWVLDQATVIDEKTDFEGIMNPAPTEA
ncbi:MAG: Cell division trigger factor (EC [uncultured Thiotrichaceae bacterium]|uniref:Trigger factor n=1 Tax=uncultured Thiotrichaceae bacterium TaxID=298394 RepID=A0A6S6UFG6_9GAMM|nr:MAG: Cell division trigger factor (EC [uncultured Thiotrichaceae bacterium]